MNVRDLPLTILLGVFASTSAAAGAAIDNLALGLIAFGLGCVVWIKIFGRLPDWLDRWF